MDTRHVFVGVVTFGLLGVATTWLLKGLERVTGPVDPALELDETQRGATWHRTSPVIST
jgi:hypothetical protein